MNFSAKRNYHWINVAFATAIIFSICAVDARARADQAAAFVMKGHYEDEFAGKHNVAGSFIVNACGSNALVDLTLENGFRQVVGTDGHDSFDYNANGQASISFGRFPTQANGAQKLLWLMSVDDSELSTNLQNYPLSFFAGYNNTDIVAQVTASGVPPNLITCIKWYAPNTILVGTRRYKLSMYPNGWLIAQLSMTKTNLVDNRVFPGEITFIQYKTRPAEMPDQQGHIASMPVRSPDDVTPVELGVFSIANFQTEHPLSMYIPEIPDKTAVVTDRRMGNLMIRVASSGKWWMARELYEQHAASVAPRKKIIAIFLLLFSLIPLVLIIKFRMSKETASKNI